MKRTAYFCALLLALSLCACGSTTDAQVTSSPAPTLEVVPGVLPEPTTELAPDIPSAENSDNGMMTNGSVVSPSPLPDASPSPAVSGAEASSSPAPADGSAK